MAGYYKRPDLTAKAIVDGWLHSGDLGYVDDDGYLYLVDRKKDMIISGGVNVYPRDIEEVIMQHPAVREVAVFGVADARWGETPIAAVVLRDPGAATTPELVAWINARVGAKFQRASDVVILDDFRATSPARPSSATWPPDLGDGRAHGIGHGRPRPRGVPLAATPRPTPQSAP